LKHGKGPNVGASALTDFGPQQHTSNNCITILDSGCTGSCIDREFVRKNNIQTKKVLLPIPVYNADKSLNEGADH
jgi:hypothetical protein